MGLVTAFTKLAVTTLWFTWATWYCRTFATWPDFPRNRLLGRGKKGKLTASLVQLLEYHTRIWENQVWNSTLLWKLAWWCWTSHFLLAWSILLSCCKDKIQECAVNCQRSPLDRKVEYKEEGTGYRDCQEEGKKWGAPHKSLRAFFSNADITIFKFSVWGLTNEIII